MPRISRFVSMRLAEACENPLSMTAWSLRVPVTVKHSVGSAPIGMALRGSSRSTNTVMTGRTGLNTLLPSTVLCEKVWPYSISPPSLNSGWKVATLPAC